MEETYQDHKTNFDVLFNHATIGIIVTDNQGRIVVANPFLLNQFGYTVAEVVGEKVEKLIPARFRERHVSHRNKYQEHPKSRPMGASMELFAVRSDGTEFPVEVSLGAYSTGEGQFVIAFVSDISYRKEAEEALRQLNADLEKKVEERTQSLMETVAKLWEAENELRRSLEKEKELNELKSRFVSIASHEFRTPLSTVLSSAYLISKYEKQEEQPQRQKHLQRIISSVNMLTDILNDFLSVGRIEEGKIQVRLASFDVKEHISHVIAEMHGLQKKQQTILHVHAGATQLVLDPALLTHIVMNLVSNAIKFSPENAVINVRTEVTPLYFTLSVKDQGIGISGEDQQHLFERFFRAANVSNIQGTGLGLHIVAKYAELLDGQVTYHSELGQGTEFTIQFKNNHTL
ncbi:MAG TPA: PAS domain-containing sensor histidine kinase [Chitinophaga sp.]